jgi:hypothetical protein
VGDDDVDDADAVWMTPTLKLETNLIPENVVNWN